VDSLVQFNPLNNSNTTMFGTGDRQKVNVAVAGGSDALRYYVTGGLTNETGMLQVPPVFRGTADSVGLPRSDWRPNTDDQRSARANTVLKLSPIAELQVNAAYMATDQRAPWSSSLYGFVYHDMPIDDAAHLYGYNFKYATPVNAYGALVGQSTGRLTGSIAAHWTPTAWLSAHATAGIDHGSQRATGQFLPQVGAYTGFFTLGSLGITNGTTDIYSFDGRAAATAQLTRRCALSRQPGFSWSTRARSRPTHSPAPPRPRIPP
jgi:hypothetical protein